MAVAPVAPELGIGLVALGAVLISIVLLALRLTVVTWLGTLLNWLASVLGNVWIIGGSIEHAIQGGVRHVEDALASAQLAVDGVATNLFRAMWHLLAYMGQTIEEIGHALEHTTYALVHVTIPHAIHDALAVAGAGVAALKAEVAHIEGRILGDIRASVRAARAAAAAASGAAAAALSRLHHAIAVTIPHEIELGLGGVRGWINERIQGLNRRLSRVEKAIGIGALAGVAFSVIARHWGFLRCRNVGKAGKAICGMDEGLLEDLLAATLVLASTISVVELAKACQAFTPEADDALRALVRELR